MRRVLATEAGGELYSKRQCMVEPVFAQTKTNRWIDRFKRRGRAAVRSEWRLITATHNPLKLHRHQLATATAESGRKPVPFSDPADFMAGRPLGPALRDILA
jgi:hypothetical protein